MASMLSPSQHCAVAGYFSATPLCGSATRGQVPAVCQHRTICGTRPVQLRKSPHEDVKYWRRSQRLQLTAQAAAVDVGSVPEGLGEQKDELKLNILRLVAGLDRGVAANPAEAQRVVEAAEKLESAAPLISLSTEPGSQGMTMEALQGMWRLVYSSGFTSGSLGGLRPGPPTGRLPILLGQVFQRIDIPSNQFDNIVELTLGVLPWPLPSIPVTATLRHSFETFGNAGVRIFFDKTIVKGGDYDSQSFLPTISTPDLPSFLRPPPSTRAGEFEVTYVDEDFRITRGDRGELRIFVRAT